MLDRPAHPMPAATEAVPPARPKRIRLASLGSASLSFVVFALILLLWWASSAAGLLSPFLVPPPLSVVDAAIELIADGSLFWNVLASLGRIVVGFGTVVVVALPLALLFGLSPRLRRLLEPPLEFLRQVPPLALVPLFILWLGIGEAQKIGVIVFATFFPVFLSATGGIAQCDPKLIEVGRALRLSRFEIVRRIMLPAALPSIVVGLRIGLGYSWRAVVGAELIAAASGLGYLIIDAQTLARTDVIFVGIFTIGGLGLLADWLARRAIRKAVPWLGNEQDLFRA